MTGTLTGSGGRTRAPCNCKNWCPECNQPKCRPNQDVPWAPGTLNTEYLDRYPEKAAIRSKPFAKEQYVPSLAKFDGRTTNKSDFTLKNGNKVITKVNERAMPDVPFAGQSTYNAEHNGKTPCPGQAKAKPGAIPSMPFDGQSTKQADYRDYGDQRRKPFGPTDRMFTVPFDGASTYNSDFDKKARQPNSPRQREALTQSNNVPNATTYGKDFVPKPFAKLSVGVCCDHARHPAETRTLVPCCERPDEDCESCVGHYH
ncbi:hypothetical protein FOA52_000053 [Chlamydomonas sp. UWO 241]|nr:hypothetical protein FOA52_000053 [Chlamydomonas sp. UWO 241]